MDKIVSPIYLPLSKKGKYSRFPLNLNRVQRMHFQMYNKLKVLYDTTLQEQVQALPNYNQIRIHYYLFTGSNQKSDLMNWISITDKFFQDTLVKAGKLKDDNYAYVPKISCSYMGVDKENPRIEIFIEELNLDGV